MRKLAAILATCMAAAAVVTASPTHAAACAGTVCEDFESMTTPGGRWTVGAPNCLGTGTVTIDQTVAHTGTRSAKVSGGGNYCNHIFLGTTLTDVTTGGTLYGRFHLRHSTPLPQAHVTFMAMRDTADNNRDLRAGGQNQALQWNRESDDATLPAQSPAGVAQSAPLPVNTWSCFEFQLNNGTLRTWLNGTEVPGLIVDGTPTPDIDQQWLNRAWKPSVTDLRLGWEGYGNDSDTLWFDDIALGTTRTGC